MAQDKQTKDEEFINELSNSILKEDEATVSKLENIVQKPKPSSNKMASNNKLNKSKHGRTVTRFCDEANIGEDDELDMAEFILAARYLGNELSEDKLMDVFMDLETADVQKDKNTKEVIKDLLKQADIKYKNEKNDDSKNNTENHEIMAYNSKSQLNELDEDDANWQEIQIDGFLTNAKQEQNLQIAKNLLQTTALSANEIAEITGVDPELLIKYEEEFETDEDFDDDEEMDNNNDNNKDKDEKKVVDDDNSKSKNNDVKNSDNAIIIKSTEFGKSLVLTKQDIGSLDELLSGGIEAISKKPKLCLQLLQKMKKGIDLTPGADKRSKHLKKLKTMVQLDIKNAANKAIKSKKKKDESKTKLPAKYRIVIVPGALIKSAKELTSKEVAKLPIGTVVTVAEIDGRRCRITEPVKGWCSVASKDGRVICQRENTKSPEMESAIHAERARQTKILILKSITTLNDATVQRILERSDWNLRRGIEAFYLAKYKTQEYIKSQDDNSKKNNKNEKDKKNNNKNSLAVNDTPKKKKKGWWKSWKKFANQ